MIEAAAVEYWKRWVGLDEEQSSEIRRVVLDWILKRQANSGRRIAAQRLRIEKLEREQQKLTEAYLADALPIDVLKREQERVHRDLAGAGSASEPQSGSVAEATFLEENWGPPRSGRMAVFPGRNETPPHLR